MGLGSCGGLAAVQRCSMSDTKSCLSLDGICELDTVDDEAVKLVSELDSRRVELS